MSALRGLHHVKLPVGDVARSPHGGIVADHQGWALVGLHDPDGIEIRLYTLEPAHAGSSR